MTHASCPDCGLRFSPGYAAGSHSCPMCCAPLRLDASAADVLGTQLFFEPHPEPFGEPPSPRVGAS